MFLSSLLSSYFIFPNFQAYFSLRNSALASRIFCWAKTNQVYNSRLLHIIGGKTCHVFTQLEHFFFHVYTRRFNWRYHHCHCHPHPHHHHCHDHLLIYCSLITSSLLRSRSCLSHVMPPPIPPPPTSSSPRVGAGRGACVTPGRVAAKETTSLVLVNIESLVSMTPFTCKLTSLVIPTCIANKRLLGLKNHFNILCLQQRSGRHDSWKHQAHRNPKSEGWNWKEASRYLVIGLVLYYKTMVLHVGQNHLERHFTWEW